MMNVYHFTPQDCGYDSWPIKFLLEKGDTPPKPRMPYYMDSINNNPLPVPMAQADADRLGLVSDDIVYWWGPFATGEVWWGYIVITEESDQEAGASTMTHEKKSKSPRKKPAPKPPAGPSVGHAAAKSLEIAREKESKGGSKTT
jgi:hypothetical protein